MENKENIGSFDWKLINIKENYEVEYWSKTLNTSSEKLKKAVATVGASVEAVKNYLKVEK